MTTNSTGLIVDKPKDHKKIRCKSSHGFSCQWSLGWSSKGGYKAVGLGNIKSQGRPVPTSFAPFELMNEVINGDVFPTIAEAENYVRSL